MIVDLDLPTMISWVNASHALKVALSAIQLIQKYVMFVTRVHPDCFYNLINLASPFVQVDTEKTLCKQNVSLFKRIL